MWAVVLNGVKHFQHVLRSCDSVVNITHRSSPRDEPSSLSNKGGIPSVQPAVSRMRYPSIFRHPRPDRPTLSNTAWGQSSSARIASAHRTQTIAHSSEDIRLAKPMALHQERPVASQECPKILFSPCL